MAKWNLEVRKYMFKKILDNFRDNDPLEKLEKINMKFDCVVMNPPYQTEKVRKDNDVKSGTCGTILWDKFVVKALDLAKENGYLCAVHPAGWRRPNKNTIELYKNISGLQVEYIEMHSIEDGIKTFGACTQYDWYVLKNTKNTSETTIKDYTGKINKINLKEWAALPNSQFDMIKKILAKTEKERCEILFSRSSYGTDKRNISETQNDEFKHPCIYSLPQKGTRIWYSNTKKNGHFGVPKVIFSNGAASQVLVDKNGEYGLTQFAYGIVDKVENLESVKKALESKTFIDLCESFRFTLDRYDDNFIALFRKDFWKEFI